MSLARMPLFSEHAKLELHGLLKVDDSKPTAEFL